MLDIFSIIAESRGIVHQIRTLRYLI